MENKKVTELMFNKDKERKIIIEKIWNTLSEKNKQYILNNRIKKDIISILFFETPQIAKNEVEFPGDNRIEINKKSYRLAKDFQAHHVITKNLLESLKGTYTEKEWNNFINENNTAFIDTNWNSGFNDIDYNVYYETFKDKKWISQRMYKEVKQNFSIIFDSDKEILPSYGNDMELINKHDEILHMFIHSLYPKKNNKVKFINSECEIVIKNVEKNKYKINKDSVNVNKLSIDEYIIEIIDINKKSMKFIEQNLMRIKNIYTYIGMNLQKNILF